MASVVHHRFTVREVYRQPQGDGRYQQRSEFTGEQTISPLAFAILVLRVDEVLGE